MEVTVKVPEQLAAEARARGVALDVYVEELLGRSAQTGNGEHNIHTVRAATDRIVAMRKGNKLAGLQAKDLIREGRKY